MEKNYVFRIPGDAIYNFCYGVKKNFLITLSTEAASLSHIPKPVIRILMFFKE